MSPLGGLTRGVHWMTSNVFKHIRSDPIIQSDVDFLEPIRSNHPGPSDPIRSNWMIGSVRFHPLDESVGYPLDGSDPPDFENIY